MLCLQCVCKHFSIWYKSSLGILLSGCARLSAIGASLIHFPGPGTWVCLHDAVNIHGYRVLFLLQFGVDSQTPIQGLQGKHSHICFEKYVPARFFFRIFRTRHLCSAVLEHWLLSYFTNSGSYHLFLIKRLVREEKNFFFYSLRFSGWETANRADKRQINRWKIFILYGYGVPHRNERKTRRQSDPENYTILTTGNTFMEKWQDKEDFELVNCGKVAICGN